MSEINRMPDEQPGLNELSDPLRRAVEHIRSQPAPQESMQRAMDRASAIHVAPPRRWFNLRPEIQVRIAVAAAILVALAVGFSANVLEDRTGNRLSRIGSSSDRFAAAVELRVGARLEDPNDVGNVTIAGNKIGPGKQSRGIAGQWNINNVEDEETLEALDKGRLLKQERTRVSVEEQKASELRQRNGHPADLGPLGSFQRPIGPPGQTPEIEDRLTGGILTPRSGRVVGLQPSREFKKGLDTVGSDVSSTNSRSPAGAGGEIMERMRNPRAGGKSLDSGRPSITLGWKFASPSRHQQGPQS